MVWAMGASVTAIFMSVGLEPLLRSRISLYSWQMAHKWQKKCVTKSPQGASYTKEHHINLPVRNNNMLTTHAAIWATFLPVSYTWFLTICGIHKHSMTQNIQVDRATHHWLQSNKWCWPTPMKCNGLSRVLQMFQTPTALRFRRRHNTDRTNLWNLCIHKQTAVSSDQNHFTADNITYLCLRQVAKHKQVSSLSYSRNAHSTNSLWTQTHTHTHTRPTYLVYYQTCFL